MLCNRSAELTHALCKAYLQDTNPMKTALLIIDVQQALFDVEPQPFEADIVVADAHTTCDKHHAGGAVIRAHENATLPNISSFGPVIKAINSEGVTFSV
jgi:hypothetical protein